MKGYKIFKTNNAGELLSCIVKGKARVMYAKGKRSRAPSWLRQHNKHLTFFPTLEYALMFKRSNTLLRNFQVWKVRAHKIIKNLELPSKSEISPLAQGFIESGGGKWPVGTAMAITIIPEEKVDKNEIRRVFRTLWF